MKIMEMIMVLLEIGIGLSFLTAAIMDLRTTYVYRFVWWIAGGCGVILLIMKNRMGIGIEGMMLLMGLVTFLALQFTVCRSWYGMADVKAFSCCAVFGAALGRDLIFYLEHMILSYALLAAVQLVKGNIARGGRLKQQVAYIPYIVMSFCIMYVCTKQA